MSAIGATKHSDIPCDKSVLGSLPMMIPLNVELHNGPYCELRANIRRLKAIAVDEEIPSEPIGVDEAPGALEGPDEAAKPIANPIARSQQRSSGNLLRNRPSTVVQRHIKLYSLSRTEWWLTVRRLVWHRQEIISMNKKVTVESGCIEESPPFGKTPHIAAVTLSEALIGLPPQQWLQCHCMRSAAVIGLYIKLDGLIILERVALVIRHDVLRAEEEIALEEVTPRIAESTSGIVPQDTADEPLVREVKRLL